MIDFIDSLNDIHGGNLFAACLDTGHAVISGSGPPHAAELPGLPSSTYRTTMDW